MKLSAKPAPWRPFVTPPKARPTRRLTRTVSRGSTSVEGTVGSRVKAPDWPEVYGDANQYDTGDGRERQ
jgi:hypothetical protein